MVCTLTTPAAVDKSALPILDAASVKKKGGKNGLIVTATITI
jgi:hypothetical protein